MKILTAIRTFVLLLFVGSPAFCAYAWTFTPEQCEGSLRPYPAPSSVAEYPDSLTPVMINHTGRHGSRYPASSYSASTMRDALLRADSLGCITPLGRRFAALIDSIITLTDGRWGQLDSLGFDEHRGIARRLAERFPMLTTNGHVVTRATYSHRAILSQHAFTYELSLRSRNIEIHSRSGKENNAMLCPFDVDSAYRQYMTEKPYLDVYNDYVDRHAPNTVGRLLGADYPASEHRLRELSIIEYYNFANMRAMGMTMNYAPYMSLDELRGLWSCFNLRQYFQHTANRFSTVPADIIAPLIADIIATGDRAGASDTTIVARFAHAETLMPLLSKLGVRGSTWLTDDYDSLAGHWHDFDVVPMATNVQLIYFRAPSGEVYVRLDHNERPTPLLAGDERIYVTWREAREYLQSLIR